MNYQDPSNNLPRTRRLGFYGAEIGRWSAAHPRLARVTWVGLGLAILALVIWAIYPQPQINRRFNNGPQPVGVAQALNVQPTLTATTDRRAALDGADYAISMIQVGGYRPATVVDFDVPKQFGLRQTIADTLGIGGIMRGLRTIPVLLDMCRDMEELCPDVTFLQYVNPMAMN